MHWTKVYGRDIDLSDDKYEVDLVCQEQGLPSSVAC